METLGNISPASFLLILLTLALWDLIWKAFGLWKAARNGQIKWFIAILIINSIGILPIIYLNFFQKSLTSKDSEANADAQASGKDASSKNNSQLPTA